MDQPTFDIYLVNGNVTIFCGAHADKFKSDILNSSLYAELVTTQQTNDAENSWLTYTDILSKFKWITNSKGSQRKEFDNARLLSLLFQSADKALPNAEREILTRVFSQIKRLESDSLAITTFLDKLNTNASVATGGTHALLTIVRKDKALLSLQISFETAGVIDIDILDKPVLTAIDDKKNNVRILRSSLDELKYSEVRDTIIKKLGSKIDTALLHIPTSTSLN